jgi:large subunit ribosomal protein L32
MPVPKRKTSKARRDQRQSTKFLRPHAITFCTNCSEPLVPHIVCAHCGFYKGRKIIATKGERTVKRVEIARERQAKQTPPQAGPGTEGHEQNDTQ